MERGKWTDKVQKEDFDRMVKRALTAIGITLEGAAISNVPVDTGRLRGSITYAIQSVQSNVKPPAKTEDKIKKPTNKYTLYVGTNVGYGADVEYGTRPHWIGSPVKMRKIGWRYIGQHPGTKAQPFLRPALASNRKMIRNLFKDYIKAQVRGK